MRPIPIPAILLLFFCVLPLRAESTERGLDFFEAKVRPLLISRCYECHSVEEGKRKGGLLLDSRQGWSIGGDNGPAIVPGKPGESLLFHALSYENPDVEMPPGGKLPEDEIEVLSEWIAMGAPDPREAGAPVTEEPGIDIEKGREFWAFRQPVKREPPQVDREHWPHSPIDRFILAKIEENGLEPAEMADERALVRRVYYDLTGLPPTPEQQGAYLADSSEDRYASLVDSLLDSPQYGQHWGRHWLDLARYADSTGGGRSYTIPEAWRYRNYVIDAYNTDKPYNQFVAEQIAGDLISMENDPQRDEMLTATGFLVLGPKNLDLQDKEMLRMNTVDEQIDTVGRSMLGLTLGCARCHDHKFDPIPTADYYAMAGIFRSTNTLVRANISELMRRPLSLGEEAEALLASLEAREKELDESLKMAKADEEAARGELEKLRTSLTEGGVVVDDIDAEKVGYWKDSTYTAGYVGDGYIHDDGKERGEKKAIYKTALSKGGAYEVRVSYTASSNRASNALVRIHHDEGPTEKRVNEREKPPILGQYISLGNYLFPSGEPAVVEIDNEGADGVVIADAVWFVPAEREGLDAESQAKLAELKERATAAAESVAKLEKELERVRSEKPERPNAVAVVDEEQPDDYAICVRGNVHTLGEPVKRGFPQVASPPGGARPDISPGESGRRELAEWLASPENPLVARVYVNRVWHHLFGTGIVRTVDNFGTRGAHPSHPELLDYLTVDFVENGWSTKKLIRKLVTSRTYRMASTASGEAMAADPDNRLLWRMSPRRLTGEMLRDSMLLASGELELTRDYGLLPEKAVFDGEHRSVYIPVFREEDRNPLLDVFDFANPNFTVGKRTISNLPTQSLFLINSPWVRDRAGKAAEKLLAETPGWAAEDRLVRAFEIVLCRPPTEREAELAAAFIEESGDGVEGWTGLCHSLFASIDLRFLR